LAPQWAQGHFPKFRADVAPHRIAFFCRHVCCGRLTASVCLPLCRAASGKGDAMRNVFAGVLVLASGFLLGQSAFGQSAFTGTWVTDLKSAQYSGNPFSFSLKDGTYRCDTCWPKVEIPADGKDHATKGFPYADSMSVLATDDSTIEIVRKKDGKVERTSKSVVSADGNTLMVDWTFFPNGQEGHGKRVYSRTAPGPAGAHKASGSWKQNRSEEESPNVLTVSYKASAEELNMSDLIGDSYTARFDGKDYPVKGDPGMSSVALKKIDAKTIEETDKLNGQVIFISRMTVSPDGQTMTVESTDKLHGTRSTYQAKRQ
jgi:hypothetical protein